MRRVLIAAGLVLLAAFSLAPALRRTDADRDLAASAHTPARAPERVTPDAADARTKDPAQRSESSAPEVIPVPNDPRAAQQMVQRRRDIEDCMRARSAWWAERWTVRTGVRWLPPGERERVERAFAQSRTRQLDSCRRQGLRLEGDALPELPDNHLDALLQAAAATGDPRARLHQLWRQRGRRDLDSQVRPVLVAALDAALREADPEMLADIGYVIEQHRDDDIGELQNGWRPGGRSGE